MSPFLSFLLFIYRTCHAEKKSRETVKKMFTFFFSEGKGFSLYSRKGLFFFENQSQDMKEPMKRPGRPIRFPYVRLFMAITQKIFVPIFSRL